MQFFILIPAILILLAVLHIKNRNKPYPRTMRLVNNTMYAIWFLSFLFVMINSGDGSNMQLPAALIFFGSTILSLAVLTTIQLMRFRLRS